MQESELFYTLSHFNDYSNRGVIMDIFEFAMDREKHAEINYLKLAASSSSSSLKSIFERLSYDEKKHLEIIRKMKEDYLIAEKKKGTNAKRIEISMEATEIIAQAKKIFSKIKIPRSEAGFDLTELDAYRVAQEAEVMSKKFYTERANESNDKNLEAIWRQLAAEEEKHWQVLQGVIEFIQAPQQYLSDAEFNNIGE